MTGARILIVDDEAHIRETMQMALDAAGYRTDGAADGPEALAKFGAGSDWDLVLLDERMPSMDGLGALRQIRERDPAARVVMVTAYGTIDLAVDAMKGGAADFLRKPFSPEVLRGAVKAALARPRQSIKAEDLILTHWLPLEPRAPGPLIRFRTLNGYEFWPVPLPAGDEETGALPVRRAFEVKAPSGEIHRRIVELTTGVRELVRAETRRDYPPADDLREIVCRSVLADYLWQRAQVPPETLLIYELSIEQLEVARRVAGLGPRARH
jgi:DNA-binding response OmpR family regulator